MQIATGQDAHGVLVMITAKLCVGGGAVEVPSTLSVA
jgi:hypothetical protein